MEEFADRPDLERAGWEERASLGSVLREEYFDQPSLLRTRFSERTGHHGTWHRLACGQVAHDGRTVPHLCASGLSRGAIQVAEHVAEFGSHSGRLRDRTRASAAGRGCRNCAVCAYESDSHQTQLRYRRADCGARQGVAQSRCAQLSGSSHCRAAADCGRELSHPCRTKRCHCSGGRWLPGRDQSERE